MLKSKVSVPVVSRRFAAYRLRDSILKYTGPKARSCRRQGMNLYGADKYDKILQRKPYPPGKSPRARLGRLSEYAKQLKDKQRARDVYGLSEKQFFRTYKDATIMQGQTGDNMKQLLEQRLDNVLFRAGLARTRMEARQIAAHGHVLINGIRVTIPSYRLRPGQVITLRDRSKRSPLFAEILESHEKVIPPSWMKIDPKEVRIDILSLPVADDAEQIVDVRQVVEFYSRT